MNEQSKKPTRKELLHELESIRLSLLPEDNSGPPSSSNTSQNAASQEGLDIRASNHRTDEQESDPQETSIETKEPFQNTNTMPIDESYRAPEVLPGQQSLFEEPQHPEVTSHSALQKSESLKRPAPQARGEAKRQPIPAQIELPQKKENPFLPTHIRKKLEQERSMYQREIDAVTRAHQKKSTSEENPATEMIVEALVAEYLPKIEAELRTRLLQTLQGTPDKDE